MRSSSSRQPEGPAGGARDAPADVSIRDDLVEAAAELFSSRGYHAASMQDLANVTGMRKASLYYHVRKKEDLLFAIHDRLIEELIRQTSAVCSTNAPVSEKLRGVMRVAMGLIGSRNKEVRVFLHEANSLKGQRWQQIVAKRDAYESMVAGLLKEGIAEGTFTPVNVGITVKGVLAMANWGYTWFKPGGPMSADDVADMFADIALRGLLKR